MPIRLPDPPRSLSDAQAKHYLDQLVRSLTVFLGQLEQADRRDNVAEQTSFVQVSSAYKPFARSVVLVDASASAVTITLPNPNRQDIVGREFTIKKVNASANNVTVVASSGTIDTSSSFSLSGTQRPAITVISDGTGYYIL